MVVSFYRGGREVAVQLYLSFDRVVLRTSLDMMRMQGLEVHHWQVQRQSVARHVSSTGGNQLYVFPS